MYPSSKPEELENQGVEQSEELDEKVDEQSEGTQGAGDQAGEQSTEGFDPSKLTPELQTAYKQMQADYTKKTQAAAEDKKYAEELRKQYEDRLLELTKANQPTSEEKPIIDESSMTPEQRQAWETLNKHRDKRVAKVIAEREKEYKKEIGTLKNYVAQMQWSQFEKDRPDAKALRTSMAEIQRQPGHENLPLDSLYMLAKGAEGFKKAGVEEYKRTVQQKKRAVTTTPSATSGEEAEIQFEKNPVHSRGNLHKAYEAAKAMMGK